MRSDSHILRRYKLITLWYRMEILAASPFSCLVDKRTERNLMMKNYNHSLKSPEFERLVEESKHIAQEGKRGSKSKAAYHMVSDMNLTKHENNPDMLPYMDYRDIADRLGISRGTVFNAFETLKEERYGIVKGDIENVDISEVEYIGTGSEFVYVYYFPTYKLYAELTGETHWPCNIGQTIESVQNRVSQQIGHQLPEKPKIALIIKTDDSQTLENKIHKALKMYNVEDAIGQEWFWTYPDKIKELLTLFKEQRGI